MPRARNDGADGAKGAGARLRRGWMMRVVVGVCALTVAVACTKPRERELGPGGVHPDGWVDKDNAAFHGRWLAENEFPLVRCRTCHGADYAGGPVGQSCKQSGCHVADAEKGPEFCGTCHGGPAGPRPTTGAHAKHAKYCDTCHEVPTSVEAEGHLDSDGKADLTFSGRAVATGMTPAWDRDSGRCTNTYCHGAMSPVWKEPSPGPLACDRCHQAPPASHGPWARVANVDTCGDCHPRPPDERHLNGQLDLAIVDSKCDACHGSGAGSPPPALNGAMAATDDKVGAHVRHLDGTLADRIGPTVACQTCHKVPTTVLAEGHFLAGGAVDQGGRAEVRFLDGGEYDFEAGTCTVWCHWKRDGSDPMRPPPRWSDASGGARQCDSCHDAPPPSHARWSRVATLDRCGDCHPIPPAATHVNGKVDFVLPEDRCDACHGVGAGSPPPALDGAMDPGDPRVGAHRRHLDGTLADRIGRPVRCDTCHAVPRSVFDEGHLDSERPADVRFLDGGGYDSATGTCNAWCHWNKTPGPVWSDTSGAPRGCDSCHGFPPEQTRKGTVHVAVLSPSVEACRRCHQFGPDTHVNGTVELLP